MRSEKVANQFSCMGCTAQQLCIAVHMSLSFSSAHSIQSIVHRTWHRAWHRKTPAINNNNACHGVKAFATDSKHNFVCWCVCFVVGLCWDGMYAWHRTTPIQCPHKAFILCVFCSSTRMFVTERFVLRCVYAWANKCWGSIWHFRVHFSRIWI